jgi:phospholipid/cholesterol/gamma-HCH transport system substrate-binding protein
MADSAAETVIGAAVLVVAGGFALYTAQHADLGVGRGAYEVSAKFRKAEGISVGGDVRISGVKVGTVRSMSLDPVDYQANLTLVIRADVMLPDDSSATIASDGLLGGAHVAIQPGGSEFMLAAGDAIQITQSSVSLMDLIGRVITGGGD